MGLLTKLRFAFDLAILLGFSAAAWVAWSFQPLARYFPMSIAVAAVVLSFVNLGVDFRRYQVRGTAVAMDAMESAATINPEDGEDSDLARQGFLRAIYYLAWALSYAGLIRLIGLIEATVLFLFLFFMIEAKARLLFSLISVVAVTVLLFVAADFMNLRWPSSLFTFF